MLKKIDLYIIKKFLGTYFLAILLIISIAVIFDFAERLDNFIEHEAPIKAVIFDYYLNFIPYFSNLFSSLFTFIAVIFFTSKLAYNSEIIAMLSGGVSFKRLLRPYMISAIFIGGLSFVLSSYVIPPANLRRISFEDQYYKSRRVTQNSNIHVELEPGVYFFLRTFRESTMSGTDMVLEKFDGEVLLSRTTAKTVKFLPDSSRWQMNKYMTRTFNESGEDIIKGESLDTILDLSIADFVSLKRQYETLTNPELDAYIKKQNERGVGNTQEYEVEKIKRFSNPFAAIILTLIGVSISSRKVRGGTGLHIGLGLLLSFSYILFSTISISFAVNGNMDPLVAVWLPNLLYLAIGIFLYIKAPK